MPSRRVVDTGLNAVPIAGSGDTAHADRGRSERGQRSDEPGRAEGGLSSHYPYAEAELAARRRTRLGSRMCVGLHHLKAVLRTLSMAWSAVRRPLLAGLTAASLAFTATACEGSLAGRGDSDATVNRSDDGAPVEPSRFDAGNADGSQGDAGDSTGLLDGMAPPAMDATPDAMLTGESVQGVVRDPEGRPIGGARVTLADGAGRYVAEGRTDGAGRYQFDDLKPGSYIVGASARGREYAEAQADSQLEMVLGPENHRGRWSVIGDTEPERPAGTPSATLLPDGRVMFCHDTLDAVLFDPTTGAKTFAAESSSSQGCHMQTVLTDGRVLFVGGQEREEPAAFTEAVRTVKAYDPVTNAWLQLPDLNEERWYPSMTRLADEQLLACGGGQRPDATRTATCEIFDTTTQQWSATGSLSQATEYSPTALLLTGEVLSTWSPPQLFNPATGTWRPTGNFVQQDRGFPDHADHSLVLLADGTALAVGYEGNGSAMVERYSPDTGMWSLGASPSVIRSQAEVVPLPDGRVLAAGGTLEQGDASTNPFGEVALTDLYDPDTDSWRDMQPMALAREYHALTLLVPDGRVITSSGTGNQASSSAPEATVEAFEPPYLFRGFRPVIDSLSTSDLLRGQTFEMEFSRTARPTGVVMVGTAAVTHWVDGGVPRRIRLSFEASGSAITATVPTAAVEAPLGYYILFLMVDDIPSRGRIVRVLSP